MKTVPVYTRDDVVAWVLVDDADLPSLLPFKWCWQKGKGYARQYGDYDQPSLMHRFILRPTDPKLVVDHINHNRLDNRRENLRLISNADNVRHRKGPPKSNTNGVMGVTWNDAVGFWYGSITIRGNRYRKHFRTKEAASVFVEAMRAASFTTSDTELPQLAATLHP